MRAIVHQHSQLSDVESATMFITFYAEGGLNKIYKIACSKGNFIIRIPLTLDPQHKVANEVATVDLL